MAINSHRHWLRDPIVLLALAAGLIAFVVQSGELGTADTQHREQSAHAFWTSEPPVFPSEYPEFGVHGRDGKLQSWYGMGQSLLMLPADIAGTLVERLPAFAHYDVDPTVRNIIVSFSTNILITVLTALVCFRFLRQLKFSVNQSVVGVLALLLATTHLHYTQNMMENNYIFLLTMVGFSYQLEWTQTGDRRALLIGCGAFALNLLTRLTTGLDLLAGGIFVLLMLWNEGTRGGELWNRIKTYVIIATPIYLLFGLIDRLYQFYRFGSFFNTYVSVVAREAHQRDPSLSIRLSLREAVPRRLLRSAVCAGEVDLSLRSAADPDGRYCLRLLAAFQSGDQGVRGRRISAAVCLHLFLCTLHSVERRLRLG